MKVSEVHEHLRSRGTWVDWSKTADTILHGDPETEIEAMAITWIPTEPVLREAAERGANVVLTHEPIFYPGYAGAWRDHDYPLAVRQIEIKRRLLDELGLTVLRSHDVWDHFPEYGIIDSWIRFLGFPVIETLGDEHRRKLAASGHSDAEIDRALMYRVVMDVSGHTVKSLADAIMEKVRPLGQDWMLIRGEDDRPVSRLVTGFGAAANHPLMAALGADVIICSDDSVNSWDGGLWSADSGIPLLIMNHATSEIPGMMNMVDYLEGPFPELDCFHILSPILYRMHV